NEQNYTNFTVERSADGGQTFNVIGGLQGSGQGVYSLIDKSPVLGRNLYRLKQEDINNNITYSNVVLVLYSEMSNNLVANNISVYPNPATSAINIAISNDAATKHSYTYYITNSLGLIVKQVTSGQPNWQPNISDLMPGSYIIKVLNTSDNSIIGNSKFIKL
ncbi:MAG: T9SS type A sorting domain-containing protein, partial [Mucilaginibacter sp.]